MAKRLCLSFSMFALQIGAKQGDLHHHMFNCTAFYNLDLVCLCSLNVLYICTCRRLLQERVLQKPCALAIDLLTLMSVLQRRLVTTIESPQLCISTSLPYCHVVSVELSFLFISLILTMQQLSPGRKLVFVCLVFLVLFKTTLMTSGGGEVEDLFL